jgi:hypothetical protein
MISPYRQGATFRENRKKSKPRSLKRSTACWIAGRTTFFLAAKP